MRKPLSQYRVHTSLTQIDFKTMTWPFDFSVKWYLQQVRQLIENYIDYDLSTCRCKLS